MTTGRTSYDLGLIIPTKEEFDYVRESVPFTLIPGSERGFWYEFRVPGGRLGVAHVLFDMGLAPTVAATIRLLERFDPEVLAVVGIGGGLSAELRLGDVVVGSVVQEYLKAAKVVPDGKQGTAFQPAGDGWPLAERLRNFVNNFRYIAEDSCKSWIHFARIRGVDADLPFTTTPGARREPGYFVLPVASGDLVVTDPAFTDWLLSHDRKRAVVEMEAAGAARAVKEYDRDVALLVLRGISDFADGRKADLDAVVSGQGSGAWRRYAAENAIELLLAFLASPSFPWRRSAPVATGQPDGAAPVGSFTDIRSSRSQGAWDYFMRVAQVLGATAAGINIVHALHPDHSPDDGAGHGTHGDHGHEGDYGDHRHQEDHGDHAHGVSADHWDHTHHDDGHDTSADHGGHVDAG